MTKRKVRRFTAERRAAFLEHLRRSGNQKAAAASVGFDRSAPEQRRKRDAAFELECRAALEEASRRLAGAADPWGHDGDAEFETVRRSCDGRTKIVRTRARMWSRRAEDLFLDTLRGCGNISASARAVGFSTTMIWQRRRKWPAFARRVEEALEEAELVLEFRLATIGNDRCPIDGEPEDAAPAPQADAAERPRFDPEFALRFLKWREEKRRGTAGRRGRAEARPPDIEEVRASIMRKIDAIERHDRPRQIAEGWTHDAATNQMIPPGWVRAEGAAGEGAS